MLRNLFVIAVLVVLLMPASSHAVWPFNYPECVVYHPGSGRYFVSSEDDGSIVQIDANWDTTYFSTELPLAVGMTIRGDTLYVSATPDGIVGFDLTGDTIALVIPVPGHTRLNDICADSSGNLWVTDPQGMNVFKVNIETRTSIKVASNYNMVNGIHYDVRHDRILLNQWVPGSPIKALDPNTYELTTVLATTGYDNLNGLCDDDRGNYYISAWGASPYSNGMIIKFDSLFNGPPVVISSGHRGAGDMCYNRQDKIIAVPNVLAHTVDFVRDPYADFDGDSVLNVYDNCPDHYNPGQEDNDADGVGNLCDNCPDNANPLQEDINNNGIGDPCETNRNWYIDPEGSGDALTIQAAIDLSTHGDTLVVADGRYTGNGNRGLDFGGRQSMVVRSENGPQAAIIDCGGSAGEQHRAFYFHDGEDSTFIVDGFTITGGYGEYFNGGYSGGAILINNCTPTIRNCVFTGNAATYGGAVYIYRKPVTLSNCTFTGNSAPYGAATFAYVEAAAKLDRCIVAFNTGGQPVSVLLSSSATLSCCDVYGNALGDWVGAITGQNGINGNFSADPLLCNVGIGDVGLADESSPCLPANNSCAALIGALGVGCGCNCGIAGDMDCSGGATPVDVAFLVKFVYLSLDALCPAPNCPYPIGDLDCNGQVTPLDAAYLVNAVYKSQNAICDGCLP